MIRPRVSAFNFCSNVMSARVKKSNGARNKTLGSWPQNKMGGTWGGAKEVVLLDPQAVVVVVVVVGGGGDTLSFIVVVSIVLH